MREKTFWQLFVLWCRWHWYNDATTFPSKDPAKNGALYEVIKKELLYRARKLDRAEKQYQRIHSELNITLTDSKTSDRYKSKISELNGQQEVQKQRIAVARKYYHDYWNICQDTGMILAEWGDREQFLLKIKSVPTSQEYRPNVLTSPFV